jgi:hypothetical protein
VEATSRTHKSSASARLALLKWKSSVRTIGWEAYRNQGCAPDRLERLRLAGRKPEARVVSGTMPAGRAFERPASRAV